MKNNTTLYALIADQLDNIIQLLYLDNTPSQRQQIALALSTITDLLTQLT